MLSALLAIALVSRPDVATLRWLAPDSSRPGTFAEFRTNQANPTGWQVRLVGRSAGRFGDRIDIIVEAGLVGPLRAELDTTLSDIARENYDVCLFSCSGGSAESLRAFLAAEHDSGLVAAVLVGDLPVAWFQMIDDWNNNRRRDPDEHYEEFPCDLYLMDIDGEWTDSLHRSGMLDTLVPGADGIYDLHAGGIVPEIGISRLPTSVLGNEPALLSEYLIRAHAYRTGSLSVPERALVYIDDDWFTNAWYWDQDVSQLYPDRVSIWDKETTRIADYRPRIDSAPFQWVQLCSHSWPGGHAMYYSNRDSTDWFYVTEIPVMTIEASFYNLFACSNVRFTEVNCGGRYVFNTAYGLGALGSSKTGSMLEFGDYYWPLSQGEPLALALRDWFSAQMANGLENWERSWYYGMCHIGDGLLKPRWTVGIADGWPTPIGRSTPPSVVRAGAVLTLPAGSLVFDQTGRRLHQAGSSLAPGLYFVRSGAAVPHRLIVLR